MKVSSTCHFKGNWNIKLPRCATWWPGLVPSPPGPIPPTQYFIPRDIIYTPHKKSLKVPSDKALGRNSGQEGIKSSAKQTKITTRTTKVGKNLRNNSRSSGDSQRGGGHEERWDGGRGTGSWLPGELGPVLMTFSFSGADCDEIARVLAGVNNGRVYYLLRGGSPALLGRYLVSRITGTEGQY